MDSGRYNFTLIIPANFQRDVQAGRKPDVQLNIDATIMSQAFIGATYIKTIALGEVNEYLTGKRDGLAQTMAKSAVRTMGTSLGREILRGVLGSVFGGRKR